MIGTKLGPYEITEEIGKGGMATVYRAYQPSMDRHVAVIVIRASMLGDSVGRDRFTREAKLIAKLEHPHLLPVYDFDGAHDPPYIVMRFLEGGKLKQVMDADPLPPEEMVYMLRQVATALDYAHRQEVVHRDLKPSNVMIDREGNAFVADFGIARVTDAGSEDFHTPTDVQRQMTVLYMDVSDFAELLYESEETDAVQRDIDRLWHAFEGIAEDHGGLLESRSSVERSWS